MGITITIDRKLKVSRDKCPECGYKSFDIELDHIGDVPELDWKLNVWCPRCHWNEDIFPWTEVGP